MKKRNVLLEVFLVLALVFGVNALTTHWDHKDDERPAPQQDVMKKPALYRT